MADVGPTAEELVLDAAGSLLCRELPWLAGRDGVDIRDIVLVLIDGGFIKVEQVTQMRDMVMTALNSGSGDTEWSTLVDLGDMLGLAYNEDTGKYYPEGADT